MAPANAFGGAKARQVLANAPIRTMHCRDALVRTKLAPGTREILWAKAAEGAVVQKFTGAAVEARL